MPPRREKVPGVERIVRLPEPRRPSGFQPLGGVAVVADEYLGGHPGPQEARRSRGTPGPTRATTRSAYRAELERSARGSRARWSARRETSARRLAQRGQARRGRLLHAAPRARADGAAGGARASSRMAGCEVWACTQDPQAARDTIAEALKIPVEQVRGERHPARRRIRPEVEARFRRRGGATLARGRRAGQGDVDPRRRYPARVLPHRRCGAPAGRARCRRARSTGWLHRSVLPSIGATFAPDVLGAERLRGRAWGSPTSRTRSRDLRAESRPGRSARCGSAGPVGDQHPHALRHRLVRRRAGARGRPRSQGLPARAAGTGPQIDPAPKGSPASPGTTAHASRSIRSTPAGYRRGRDWPRRRPAGAGQLPRGHGRGIAVHRSFLSYVAAVVEVEVKPDGSLTIPQVDMAVDGGFVAHPERARAQMEGAAVMGARATRSTARSPSRTGKVVQSNYGDYRVMRIDARPASHPRPPRAQRQGRRAASASRACRRSRPRSRMRSSPPPGAASGVSPWRVSSRRQRPDARPRPAFRARSRCSTRPRRGRE